MIRTDLCVIGGGSGGLSVAAGAAQMGADVVLIEGHKMGGDCLNYGCVPSKALLHASKTLDYADAMEHVRGSIATIAPHDSVERFEGLGVNVIQGFARFVSKREVQVGTQRIRARRFVVATGSSPTLPTITGLEDVPYLTNETLFENPDKPKHLLIIGGGHIGMEMAQAHRRLGCDVTVIEAARAFGHEDPEMSAYVLDALRETGVEIVENALAQRVQGKAGDIKVETQDGRIFKGSHLLVAVGRRPNIDRLDLHAAGVEVTQGRIKVNARLKSTNHRVYAIGDVASPMQFTHVAGYHAGVVIRSALFGMRAKASHDHIPRVTFTAPELAQVGPTEEQARAEYGDKLQVVRFKFSGNDRAITDEKPTGLIKVMVHRARPVGVSIVGPDAGELIALWSLVMAQNLKMSAVTSMIAPYPTLSEINKRVAGAYYTPHLFDNPRIKRIVRFVQKWLP